VPGGPVEETFAGRPPGQFEAYEAIMAHLDTLGPVHVDAVGVGVFLKSDRKLAELRPMARALSVDLLLSQPLAGPRIARTMRASADRTVSCVRVQGGDDVDEELKGWLTRAYREATDC
jgi:hypothetical protein